MSFISTFSSLSKNGWSGLGAGDYQLLATTGNLTITATTIKISNDGLNVVGIFGTGNSNLTYYNINSNNVITLANTIAGNTSLAGATAIAYAKQTKDVVAIGSSTSDVGGTNRGAARIYRNEVLNIHIAGTANSQGFGANTTSSNNGNIVGIIDSNILGNRSAYIYEYNGSTYTLRDTITPYPPSIVMASYMDGTGNILVTTDQTSNTVVVYNYSGNAWSIQANLTPANVSNLTNRFGQQIIINESGNTIVMTDPEAINNANSVGRLFVFKNISNVWSEYQQIDCPIINNTYGALTTSASIGIDQNGENIVIPVSVSAGTGNIGTVVFSNINGNYTFKQFLDPVSSNVEYFTPSDISGSSVRIATISQNVLPITDITLKCFST
jgi:hypothetical protein